MFLWSKDKSSPVSPSIPLNLKRERQGEKKVVSTFGSSHKVVGPHHHLGKEPIRILGSKEFGRALPKAWKVFEDAKWNMGNTSRANQLVSYEGCGKVVLSHRWFPGHHDRDSSW